MAFPHARLKGLREPLIIPARISKGIHEWDSEDSQPVTLAFLVLTPEEEPELQLTILKDLVKQNSKSSTRHRLLSASDGNQIVEILREALPAQGDSRQK